MAEGPLKAKEQIKVRSYVNRQQTVRKHSNMQGTPSELLPCFSSFSFYFHPFFSFPLLLSGPSLPLTFLLLILSPSCLLCPIHSFLSYLFLSTLFFPLSLYSSQHLDMEEDSKSLKGQLLSVCPSLERLPSLDDLLAVWQGVRGRMFMHYQLAARAYFTFLKLSGSQASPDWILTW